MQETVLIGELELDQVLDIQVRQARKLAAHPIPGWDGDLLQDLGEAAAEVYLRGVARGPDAGQRLENLRGAFRGGEPLDFVASASVATEVAQILPETLDVVQSGDVSDAYFYAMTMRRYVPPPTPSIGGYSKDFLGDLSALEDAAGLADTQALADMMGTAEGALNAIGKAMDILEDLKDVYDGVINLKPLLSALANIVSACRE